MPANPNRLLPLLALLTILAIITTSIYMPSVPAMARALNTDVAAVQFTLTIYLIMYAVCQLLHGPLSDQIGRRPVLLGGLAVTLVASIACACAPNIGFLIAARIAQGIGSCAAIVVSRAVVRDLFSREGSARANSIIGIASALAPALGPVLGGQLEVFFSWRASFVFLALMSALTLALAGSQLPETNPYRSVSRNAWRGLTSGYGILLTSKPFWGFSLVVCGMFAGIYAFIAGSPVLFIDQLGISAGGFGVIAALSTIGSLGGNIVSNRLTVQIGIERLVLLGSLVMTVAGLGMFALALSGYFNVTALIAPMMLFGVGLGLAMPNAYAGVVSLYPAYAGTAAALTGCLQMVFASAGSLLVAWLPRTSSVPLTLVIAAAGLTSLLGWLALGHGTVPPNAAPTAAPSQSV